MKEYNLPWRLPSHEYLKEKLISTYSHDAREYHNLMHLSEMFTRLDELKKAGEQFNEDAVNLAVWYHDAVYDSKPQAEERSAQLAEDELSGIVPDEILLEVVRLILLTETHKPQDSDTNGKVLSDADIAILSSTAERYSTYSQSVRKEYSEYPDDLFALGRIEVLKGLLNGPLFHTEHGRIMWEATARENIGKEIETLTSLIT